MSLETTISSCCYLFDQAREGTHNFFWEDFDISVFSSEMQQKGGGQKGEERGGAHLEGIGAGG